MQITIGGREQIKSVSISVPPKEDAWIEFSVEDWNIRIHVVFEDDQENSNNGFTLAGKEDHAILTIKNWNNVLPSAITQPFEFGEVKGKKIFFLFSGYAIAGFKKIDFSFFWEVPNVK